MQTEISIERELEKIAERLRAERPGTHTMDWDEYDRRLALYGERFDSRLPDFSYGEDGA